MSKIGIFMADGCEEIEGLTVVDIVRRAKMDITMISVNGKREVTSSHGVTFLTDAVAEEVDYDALDGIVLPGVGREGGVGGHGQLASHHGGQAARSRAGSSCAAGYRRSYAGRSTTAGGQGQGSSGNGGSSQEAATRNLFHIQTLLYALYNLTTAGRMRIIDVPVNALSIV